MAGDVLPSPPLIELLLALWYSYKLGGHVVGQDRQEYNAFISFELVPGRPDRLSMIIRLDNAGNKFPPSAGLAVGVTVVAKLVNGLLDVRKRWGQYLDAAGKIKKGIKIEGANARDYCLEKWWLETFPDPRGDIQETDHAMAASKTCIPDTNITEPSAHINLEAYRVRDASATRVIAQFLEVKLTINDNLLAGNGFSTLQIIESAFLNKAIRSIQSMPSTPAMMRGTAASSRFGVTGLDHLFISCFPNHSPGSPCTDENQIDYRSIRRPSFQQDESAISINSREKTQPPGRSNEAIRLENEKRKRECEIPSQVARDDFPNSKKPKVDDKISAAKKSQAQAPPHGSPPQPQST